jgi:hypothetical protein
MDMLGGDDMKTEPKVTRKCICPKDTGFPHLIGHMWIHVEECWEKNK